MRRALPAGVLALASGCFHPAFDRPRCGPDGECPDGLTCNLQRVCDVPQTENPDGGMPPSSTRFGTIFPVTLTSFPVGAVNVTSADVDIDTNASSPSCDPGVASYCAVAGTTFTVSTGRKLSAHGSRPLVLVAVTKFDLSGDIDVSSSLSAQGAGAISAIDCASVTPPPVPANGASGGYGGSFGGKGSDGDAVNGSGGVASPATVAWPSALRGGCPGGNGGAGGALGGNGGGAVMIIADSLTLSGKTNASGAGGRGGSAAKSGGGGGGSGGMIVLDIRTGIIRTGGVLFASGGGGGEGGQGGVAPFAGLNGGAAMSPSLAATGGSTSADGGDGGQGSFGHFLAGGNTSAQIGPDGGGGGGGGAAGMIYAPGITGDGIIAPPSSSTPPP